MQEARVSFDKKAWMKTYCKEYKERNKERDKVTAIAYRERNKERLLAYIKAWDKENW